MGVSHDYCCILTACSVHIGEPGNRSPRALRCRLELSPSEGMLSRCALAFETRNSKATDAVVVGLAGADLVSVLEMGKISRRSISRKRVGNGTDRLGIEKVGRRRRKQSLDRKQQQHQQWPGNLESLILYCVVGCVRSLVVTGHG